MQIIKVRFLKSGIPFGRNYTYYSEHPVSIGDTVKVNEQALGLVVDIDVPEEEIEGFRDKVKFVHGKVEE